MEELVEGRLSIAALAQEMRRGADHERPFRRLQYSPQCPMLGRLEGAEHEIEVVEQQQRALARLRAGCEKGIGRRLRVAPRRALDCAIQPPRQMRPCRCPRTIAPAPRRNCARTHRAH